MNAIEILLIEDNAGDALLIQQALVKCPLPIKMHIARDGEQALQMLADSSLKLELIILDLNIPRIEGHAVLERYEPKNVPVVIFSSSWNPAEVERAMALGARDYVQKPTDLQAYADAVCGMVEQWVKPKADEAAT